MTKIQIKDYIKEVQSLFFLAFPLMLMQVFSHLKGMVDTMMVGHIDEIQLAGMSLANSIHILFMLFQGAFSLAVVPLVSNYYARNDYESIKKITQQVIYVNILLAIFFSIVFINGNFFFSFLNILPETKNVASDSLKYLGYANIFVCFSFVFKNLIQGLAKNKQLLFFTGFSFFLNIPLNMVFIYGVGNIVAPMGGVGSAIATSICFFVEFLLVLLYVLNKKEINPFSGKFAKINYKKVKNIISSGLAIGLGLVMEVGLFASISFLISNFGEVAISANQVAMNFTGIVFMFSLGLSLAVMQKSSYLDGLNDFAGLKRVVFSSAGLSIFMSIISVSITLTFKETIIGWYTSESEVAVIAVNILIISGLYQVFDSLQITALGLLRSYKLYNSILKRAFVSYWIVGAGSGYLLSLKYGVYGYWFGFILCFIFASSLYYKKVYNVVWRKVKTDN